MGRGNKVGKCPGNLNFRRVCWKHKARYLKSYKEEKSRIASEVLDEIQKLDPPGRFLEMHGNFYVVVHPARALEKTCQLLREKKVKKPEGMESLPMQRIQVNKSLRRRKSIKAIDYQDYLSEEDDEQETTPSSVVSMPKKTVNKKKTPSKPKHVAKGSHDKAITVEKARDKGITMKKAIKSIGKTPRRNQRQDASKLDKKEGTTGTKIEKEGTQGAKVQAEVTSSGSFASMTPGGETEVSPPLIHPVTPSPRLYFGTPSTQPVMAFEPEPLYIPEESTDDKPMEMLQPCDLLRGLSDYIFCNESAGDFKDSDFESEPEKITEPPPFTSFSSRGTALCSVHLGFERVANTFENKSRESPCGVIDIPGPPVLRSHNSLFIDEIDGGEIDGSAAPFDIFGEEGDDEVKRKLWY